MSSLPPINPNQEANKITPLLCRFSLLFAAAGICVMAIFARQLVPLAFGSEFLPSVRPLLFILPGILSMTIFMILNSDLTGRGKAKITLFVFLGSLLINVTLNLILIPKFAAEGAALSSTISYSVGAISLAMIFSVKYSIPFLDLILVKKSDFELYITPLLPQIGRMLSPKKSPALSNPKAGKGELLK